VIVPTVFLGASIDAEPDGQPDVLALGDDNDLFYPSLGDDEDGIVFKSALIAGMNASFDVTASLPGWLDVWLDVDNSGTWTAPDLVFGGNIPGGTSTQNFGVPAGVASGINYMRFRFNAGGVALPPSGSAQDGEVEDYIVQIGELDWGDAPDVAGGPGFETLGFNNGANHLIIPNLFMGNLVDAEPDGQPTAQADGDDLDVLYPSMGDDEDGVVFLTPLIPGVMAQVNVTVTPGGGWLAIWLDSDQSGTWAPVAERVFLGNVVGGVNTINFVVPAGTLLGPNYMRFRLTQSLLASYPGGGGPVPYGPAIDGEVEDYQVWVIEEADWGDAPDALMPPQYPTLAVNNGAFHAMSITPGMFLGAGIDSDPDGQPTPGAIGDDLLDGNDDEDGLVSVSHLAPGQPAVIKVVASLPGFLDAWLDYNANGNWADPLDQILASHALNPGTNTINIVVPPGAVSTNSTYVRLRYGSAGGLPPTGQALDGEVEDYKVRIEEAWLDWGDAPDPNYPTLSTSSGAAHLIVTNGPAIGPILGAIADLDADGQPNASATGDDGDGSDDEDGVTFKSKVVAGTNVTVEVVVGVAAGKLDAWVDFNDDGDWADGSEQIFNSQAVGTGTNNLNFAVPQPSALGGTIARFRISSSGGLSYDNSGLGYIPDGEVEDYAVDLYQPQPSTNIVITNLFFSASNAVAQVEWNSESNITYQLQSSTNLMTNVWVDVEATVLGPVYWQTNNMSAETTKFYRVTVPWTP